MTAEIAILNKTAVALAADSAVTISAGSKEEKIFDTAEKLFELSDCNPIGIMLYNGMSFAEIPLPSLIKEFRNNCPDFEFVKDAAYHFLNFLDAYAKIAPTEVRENTISRLVDPIFRTINEYIQKSINDRIYEATKTEENFSYRNLIDDIVEDAISIHYKVISELKDAQFFGSGPLVVDGELDELLERRLKIFDMPLSKSQKKKMVDLAKVSLKKDHLSDAFTGLVIAGFGNTEMFTTLISFEIDGFVCGRLKYNEINYVDIKRSGVRAKVLPFAQKEMVERFLYGLDAEIQNLIVKFCQSTISAIPKQIFKRLKFSNPTGMAALEKESAEAEKAFVEGLKKSAFDEIRSRSQSEIDDMVEFMPKPELADMAESLVNLTSLKRRVSRGMETVGGPIDVAIISKSEGFVWVKRKHYFPADLNRRYFNRTRKSPNRAKEVSDAKVTES